MELENTMFREVSEVLKVTSFLSYVEARERKREQD
jgi:hypothetical protein